MNFDRDPTITDDYFVTALQIFDGCGVESSGSLRLDALMDTFAPSVKTNKAELSFLRTLLDPEQNNPDINVTKLAKALHKYSENQKTKVDLEESFNLRTGSGPQDSDSGISSDGIQILEELQCELKEKEHLTHQLRSQLDFTDRQHEEALAALTAERDSLLRHLAMVRDENAALSHVRLDYDESCERLCASETELAETKRELDSLKKRARVSQEQVASLELEKLTLQELLSKSRDECHRINEMYATRQSDLLEENETFKAENAELSSRFQDQEDFIQQILKEKVLLEMELKDMLNKSNQTHLRLDRSIDVSYTEDQMLTALDTLNANSQFAPGQRLLDEESFASALNEDQGRVTNISLYDEIRLSICNMSRLSEYNSERLMDSYFNNNSGISFGTQTDENDVDYKKDSVQPDDTNVGDDNVHNTETDTHAVNVDKVTCTQTNVPESSVNKMAASTQTYITQTLCYNAVSTQTNDIEFHDEKHTVLSICKSVKDMSENVALIDQTLKILDAVETQTDNESKPFDNCNKFENIVREKSEKIVNTVETQTDVREDVVSIHMSKGEKSFRLVSIGTQTLGALIKRPYVNPRVRCNRVKIMKNTVETQTHIELFNTNNNSHGYECLQCETANKYTAKLERDVRYSNLVLSEVENQIAKYEENLTLLQCLVTEEDDKNKVLKSVVEDLTKKLEMLEAASEIQSEVLKQVVDPDVCCVDCQTDCDQSSVSTQVEVPCVECENRGAVTPYRNLRRFFWDPLKCLFQLFAVICFFAAVWVLCGVARSGVGPEGCRVAPWRWLHVQDIVDLLFRIEYTAEVPM